MMFKISEEENCELITGFIRYVFEELRTEGWKSRRDEFLTLGGFGCENDFFRDEMTFDKMMEKKLYNLDEVISCFLCRIITNLDATWFLAWIYQFRPDLDIKEERVDWSSWARKSLCKFMYLEKSWHTEKVNYELMREILGFYDIDLK